MIISDFLNSKYFYNITLNKGGFITKIDNSEGIIEIVNNNIYSKIKYNDFIIFRKISDDELLKLLIIENMK